MNLRFAVAACALAAMSVGCTTMQPGCGTGVCGQACGPCRPDCADIQQGRCNCGEGICDSMGWTQKGACNCTPGCRGCGPFGSGPCGCNGGGCCGGQGCLQGGLSGLLDCNQCGDQYYNFAPGPPVGQTAYPYYTTRGPRDFLMANPPTIGPR